MYCLIPVAQTHFATESLLRLWLLCDNDADPATRKPALKGVFNQQEAIAYENILQTAVFDPVSANMAALRRPYNALLTRKSVQGNMLQCLLELGSLRRSTRLNDGIVPTLDSMKVFFDVANKQDAEILIEEQNDPNGEVSLLSASKLFNELNGGMLINVHVAGQAAAFLRRLETALHLRITEDKAGISVADALRVLRTLGEDVKSCESLSTCFQELKRNWAIMRLQLQHTDTCPELRRALRAGVNIAHELEVLNLTDDTPLLAIINPHEESDFRRVLKSLVDLQAVKFVGSVRTLVNEQPMSMGISEHMLLIDQMGDSELVFNSILPDTTFGRGLILDGRYIAERVCQAALSGAVLRKTNGVRCLTDFNFSRMWECIMEFTLEKKSAVLEDFRMSPFKFKPSIAVSAGTINRAPSVPDQEQSIVNALGDCLKLLNKKRLSAQLVLENGGSLSTTDQRVGMYFKELTTDELGKVNGLLQVSPRDDVIAACSLLLQLLRCILRPDDDDLIAIPEPSDNIDKFIENLLQETNLPSILKKLSKLKAHTLIALCYVLSKSSSDVKTVLFQHLPQELQSRLDIADLIREQLDSMGTSVEVIKFAADLLTILNSPRVRKFAMSDVSLPLLYAISDDDKKKMDDNRKGGCSLALMVKASKKFVVGANLMILLQIVFSWHARLTAVTALMDVSPTEALEPQLMQGNLKYCELVPASLREFQRPRPPSPSESLREFQRPRPPSPSEWLRRLGLLLFLLDPPLWCVCVCILGVYVFVYIEDEESLIFKKKKAN